MYNIKKIQLKELLDFSKSEQFLRLQNKPISSLRISSYLNNPLAKQDDLVLYMAFDDEKLVGYRTIWRDRFFLSKKANSFGWLSGSWVHPKYRRKGISTKLFEEVYKDWEGNLMFTNYAINAKLLFDKTRQFSNIKSLQGTRYYSRFCLSEILERKHKIFSYLKFIFLFFDIIFNYLVDLNFLFFKKKVLKSEVRKDEVLNPEIDSFLKDFKEKEFFKRDKNTYEWIKNFPWINKGKDLKKESQQYYFSLFAKDFQSNYYTFYNSKKELVAFVWLSLRDGHLKIPYVYFKKNSIDDIVNFILAIIKEEKIKTILVYQKEIEEVLNSKRFFITKKTFYQNFFATINLELNSNNIEKMKIQSGNGDVIFT